MKTPTLLILALLASAPAMAADGSWADVSNLGGVNAAPGTRPGGGMENWCCGRFPPDMGRVPGANAGSWGRAFQSIGQAIGDWFSGPRTSLGQVNYSAGGYGIGIGGFDPESRGSGVKAW